MFKKNKENKMFTSLDQIKLGAKYKHIVSGHIGICVTKEQHLTGCDRVELESQLGEGGEGDVKVLGCDITTLEYVDEGVTAWFEQLKEIPEPVLKGGPSKFRSRYV